MSKTLMPAIFPRPVSPAHAADHLVAARCPLFLTHEWFELLERHGLPAGSNRNDATFGQRVLRLPLMQDGSSFHALSSYYSADFGVQGGTAPAVEDVADLARWLRTHGARRIELRPLHADAALLGMLMPALRQQAYLCDTFHVSTNWYLPCAGLCGADYLAARPSRLANTLRRCRKRLLAEPSFRLDITTTADSIEAALLAYAKVYAQSWKEPEAFPDFIPQLCRMTAAQGWLRLGLLYLGGEPVAAQVWFVKDGTASIYKLAYDSRFARLGVGTVLTAALAEHVLDVDKVCEIDFLTGDDAYKAEWMTHSRPLVGMIAFDARSVSGLLHAALHFGRRWLRRFKPAPSTTNER
ncbi:GNAT family N-acetyltransferase [Uliginosibacterium sp. H3]|uniref:GNAT family N-acetyltransferase n=1 Tax=Uliginosibacterium silvisoli TaxID=3114758 RepID=A0ABU6K5Y2_9RHOO|nr:GNAT family N-acetyltransferase [Uliginosibacterium sp. H3]